MSTLTLALVASVLAIVYAGVLYRKVLASPVAIVLGACGAQSLDGSNPASPNAPAVIPQERRMFASTQESPPGRTAAIRHLATAGSRVQTAEKRTAGFRLRTPAPGLGGAARSTWPATGWF